MNKWLAWLLCSLCWCIPQEIIIKPGDTLNKVLRTNGVANSSIHQINAHAAELAPLSLLSPNDTIIINTSAASKQLLSAYIYTKHQTYVLNLINKRYVIAPITAPHNVEIITTSSDTKPQTEKERMAQRTAAFLFPNHSGDIFAAFDKNEIISIKLTSSNHNHYAFLDKTNVVGAYYSSNGEIITPVIAKTPTHYKRVSSPFNPHRLHPISKKVMPHKGVDLAAPMNTPIWAAATGKVIHKSADTGYGNMLIIDHGNGIHTYYAHLNKFHSNIGVGSEVSAFETIGYVGSTGHSTGPHLHFETRIDNTPHDPLTFSEQHLLLPPKSLSNFPFYF